MITRFIVLVSVFSLLTVSGYGCFDSGNKAQPETKQEAVASKKVAKDFIQNNNKGVAKRVAAKTPPKERSKDIKPLTKQHLEGFVPDKIGKWNGGKVKGESVNAWGKKDTGSWVERQYTYKNQKMMVKLIDTATVRELENMIKFKTDERRKLKKAVFRDVKLGNAKSTEFYIPEVKKSAMVFPIRGRIVAEVTGEGIEKIGITTDFVRQMNMSKFSNGSKPAIAVPFEKNKKAMKMHKKMQDNPRRKPGSKAAATKRTMKAGHKAVKTHSNKKQQKTATSKRKVTDAVKK